MTDVLCLGEILVDWVCTTAGAELDEARSFTKAAGGAPANVAVGLSRQGVSTGFIGRVSNDLFGLWLKDILEKEGIDTRSTVLDPMAATRMAYVVTTSSGDRKLAEFSRIACADAQLCQSDLDHAQFSSAFVLHFGSISLIAEPAATATRRAIELAKDNGLLVSYDPNVRIGLWPSPEQCRETILDTLHFADIVKINLDELEFLTGRRDFQAAEALRRKYKLPLIIITLDSQGCFFSAASGARTVPGFKVELVEATGAGDGFVSGILAGLIEHIRLSSDRRQALIDLPVDVLAQVARRANAIGALACTRAGAIPALPRQEEIEQFLAARTAQTSS